MAPQNAFPRTVLVVEDEVSVADLLAAVFKKHNLAHKVVNSAEEAMRLLGEERFGCVLTDKNLPGQSGLEVVRIARRLHPWCACVVMTGHANSESIIEALRLGATDYLEKPFTDLKLVVQKIQSAMEHARTAYERTALVRTLREMSSQLAQSKEESFRQQTELDVFTQVVELKIEEATREQRFEIARLAVQLKELRDAATLRSENGATIAEELKRMAAEASEQADGSYLSVEAARSTLRRLAHALNGAINTLRQ